MKEMMNVKNGHQRPSRINDLYMALSKPSECEDRGSWYVLIHLSLVFVVHFSH